MASAHWLPSLQKKAECQADDANQHSRCSSGPPVVFAARCSTRPTKTLVLGCCLIALPFTTVFSLASNTYVSGAENIQLYPVAVHTSMKRATNMNCTRLSIVALLWWCSRYKINWCLVPSSKDQADELVVVTRNKPLCLRGLRFLEERVSGSLNLA